LKKSLYSAGKEISVLHGNSFAKLMIKINDINQRINYQNQQKDEKIRSLNDKIKTLRKDVNDLIQETKSLKCQNIKKE
jgi:TolA-binding protein